MRYRFNNLIMQDKKTLLTRGLCHYQNWFRSLRVSDPVPLELHNQATNLREWFLLVIQTNRTLGNNQSQILRSCFLSEISIKCEREAVLRMRTHLIYLSVCCLGSPLDSSNIHESGTVSNPPCDSSSSDWWLSRIVERISDASMSNLSLAVFSLLESINCNH